jgi:hypothetical protein
MARALAALAPSDGKNTAGSSPRHCARFIHSGRAQELGEVRKRLVDAALRHHPSAHLLCEELGHGRILWRAAAQSGHLGRLATNPRPLRNFGSSAKLTVDETEGTPGVGVWWARLASGRRVTPCTNLATPSRPSASSRRPPSIATRLRLKAPAWLSFLQPDVFAD